MKLDYKPSKQSTICRSCTPSWKDTKLTHSVPMRDCKQLELKIGMYIWITTFNIILYICIYRWELCTYRHTPRGVPVFTGEFVTQINILLLVVLSNTLIV